MSSRVTNIVDTDMKTIRTFREVHKTMEQNAFIEEQERLTAEKAAGGRQDLKLENERNWNQKQEKKKDQDAMKEKEAKDKFVEEQEEALDPVVEVCSYVLILLTHGMMNNI